MHALSLCRRRSDECKPWRHPAYARTHCVCMQGVYSRGVSDRHASAMNSCASESRKYISPKVYYQQIVDRVSRGVTHVGLLAVDVLQVDDTIKVFN